MVIDARFYAANRARLTELLKGGLVVLSGYKRMQRSNDMAHKFDQESNFWYLCGIEEPEWMLICDGRSGKSWLVEPTIDATHRIFEGSISDSEAADISGINTVISHDEGLKLLRTLTRTHSVCYTIDQPSYSDYFNFVLNPNIKETKRMLERIFPKVQSCNQELTQLRAIKQPAEIAMMKKAIGVTTAAFEKVHQNFRNYKHEYEIEAEFSCAFRSKGHQGHAYDPIVASGNNACTLHYSKNDCKLKPKQLVLIDVGARAGGYAADITRTYAYGEPTKRQLAVHNGVEQAHKQIINLVKPDLSVEEYNRGVENIMNEVLDKLGLNNSTGESLLRRYFPHAISHGLGIDPHDSLGGAKYFKSGMVITVEPGIYIPEENIGVRIEDNILVTDTGKSNLSGGLSTGV